MSNHLVVKKSKTEEVKFDPIQENELLKNALNVLEDGIHIVDRSGNTIFYSKGLEKIEQSKSTYVLGKHISEAYQLDENTSILLKVLNSGVAVKNQHATYLTSRGKTINIITNTYPIYSNGSLIAAVSINKDITANRALAEIVLKLQKELLSQSHKSKNGTQYCFEDIVGTSDILVKTVEEAKKCAINLSPVLIQGETGTGKELFAQSIHNYSPRSNGPFVAVNCAAIPETLLESILFGTVKGAFTGAEDKRGLFEEADTGTLFLDELNSMSMLLQTKLLRVLESKKIRRVGGNKDIFVNPRIISAINVDPNEAISKGQLRKDIYYRLAVVSLIVPTLKDRIDDIPLLVKYFIDNSNKVMGKDIKEISKEVLTIFTKYFWPGNVRELHHTIEHAMNMAEANEKRLDFHHLQAHFRQKFTPNSIPSYKITTDQDLKTNLLNIERDLIIKELNEKANNITQTAKSLGISRQHLQYRLKRLDININEN